MMAKILQVLGMLWLGAGVGLVLTLGVQAGVQWWKKRSRLSTSDEQPHPKTVIIRFLNCELQEVKRAGWPADFLLPIIRLPVITDEPKKYGAEDTGAVRHLAVDFRFSDRYNIGDGDVYVYVQVDHNERTMS